MWSILFNKHFSIILFRIPCIIEYVEKWPTKCTELHTSFYFMWFAPTCFGNNYAIFREQLSSLLSYVNVSLGRKQVM
jgi:hypothetical protein